MKLYMKQKVFSFRDKFTIKDENGNDKYYVEGEILSLGKKLRVYDMHGNKLAFVREKLVTFMPKFTVEIHGREIAEIVKKITLFTPKYYVNGLGWDVDGDLFSHNYVIYDRGRIVVSIHKQWMAWGDTFELDVHDEKNEIAALAVVLAIDAVMNRNSNAGN